MFFLISECKIIVTVVSLIKIKLMILRIIYLVLFNVLYENDLKKSK